MARKGEGQTALVTGASMGIGVDLAECFAQRRLRPDPHGALGRRAAGGGDAARPPRTAITATPIAGDLSASPAAARRWRAAIAERGLHVDVLVNNAGYGIAGAFDGSDRTDQLGMIDLNDRALVELTHLYWPRMLAKRRGGVLNVASTASFQPGPLMAIYYASKAFVLSFSEALWKEAEGTGVHVSCLCPGPTASKFRERAGTGKTRLSRAGTPMTSAEVAKLGYDGWRANRRVVITGARNAILARLVPFLPRRAILGLVHSLQSPA